MTDSSSVPQHVGFIVDGNRRWAKKHGLPTYEGHLAGFNACKEVAEAVWDAGVKNMSLYVFSTENWKRSKKEVAYLMQLIMRLVKEETPSLIKREVRLKVIGSSDRLGASVKAAIHEAEQATAHFTNGTLLLCIDYGGQMEIADAVKKIIKSGIKAEEVTPEIIEQNIYSPDVPPVDMIIRTSGEQRLSNFMLWRSAYSELLFLEKQWPEMTKDDVTAILKEYNKRSRRFGG